MFKYILENTPEFINLEEKILDKIFKNIDIIINSKKQNWTLNIVFCNTEYIKNLNKNYRNIDKETDVLSFHYYEDFELLKSEDTAWEVIICSDIIKSQALDNWNSNEQECYVLIIHSILHILWYDHEEDSEYIVMKKLEDKIYKKIFN